MLKSKKSSFAMRSICTKFEVNTVIPSKVIKDFKLCFFAWEIRYDNNNNKKRIACD